METERKEFEAAMWAYYVGLKAKGWSAPEEGDPTPEALFWREESGKYGVLSVEAAWNGWQMARKSSAQPLPQVEQSAEFAGWQHRVYYTDNNDPGWSNWREVLECDMGTIQKLAREYPARHQMRPVYTAPQQSAQPVAWMHETPGRVDVIHDEVKKLLSAVATDYLYRPIDKSEKYTIPLYAAAQPVEVQPLTNAQVSEGQDSNGLFPGSAASCVFTMGVRYAESKHGIKPTSGEGGA